SSRESSTRTCYNCGDTGHMIKDCPKPRAQGAAQGNALDLSGSRGGRHGGRGRANQGRGRGGRG
ncbi:unnamed protein product, partial [Sphacelaria rigidula]